MPQTAPNIFDYCDTVREQFKHFSLGRGDWAADIKQKIDELRQSDIWSPQALLQISPQYESVETVPELVQQGVLRREWLALKELNRPLYLHQRQAIDMAGRGDNYVITAGTGSGKSLGYIIPIVDKIFADKREGKRGIKAVICYPMNALVNSQIKELQKFKFEEQGIRYARYTGQENQREREIVQSNPPDILLTNFMMLEYMLTRNREQERPILQAMRDCEFLVMDELHTYRGRQGADIAMLIRRLRLFLQRDFLCIGTSATMTSGEEDAADDSPAGENDVSKALVAEFTKTLFGSKVLPQNVIQETLKRRTNANKHSDDIKDQLNDEIKSGVDALLTSEAAFTNSAVAVWCEFQFGIDFIDQRLVRKAPISLNEAAKKLHEDSGIAAAECERFLRDFLTKAASEEWFAVRLHQFFSGPGQFLSTIKNKQGEREFSVQGEKDNKDGDLYYSTHFCRNCTHEFHPVTAQEDGFTHRDIDEVGSEKDGDLLGFGFITPAIPNMKWTGEGEESNSQLPDEWLEQTRKGEIRIRGNKENFIPQKIFIDRKGKLQADDSAAVEYIFCPGKFRFCPNCGDVHDGRGRDVNRLMSLNAEGRSSATTVLLLSLLGNEPQFRENSDAKTLSFCDNRQDAALQAGYFNDFVFTLKLRAGLLKALEDAEPHGALRHDNIAHSVREALGFSAEEVMNNPNRRREFLLNPDSTNIDDLERLRELLRDIIGYHLMRDLRRGWRHNNPNLEKLKLLEMQFEDVEKLGDINQWIDPPHFIQQMDDNTRRKLAEVVLRHMLEEKCVNSHYLSDEKKESIASRASDNLNSTWYDKSDDRNFEVSKLLAPKATGKYKDYCVSGGSSSRLAAKIRPRRAWGGELQGTLSVAEYNEVFLSIMQTLTGINLVVEKKLGSDLTAWQLNCNFLIWRLTDQPTEEEGEVNYYTELYQSIKEMLSDLPARADLAVLEAREHTAQVSSEDRQEYEKRFRGKDGKTDLPVLVCSPTMELGIDISDLTTVYLRNVPPTPANYVQRSGRAGRAGTPALVVSYCAAQSPHDQYYFSRQKDMVAGRIRAPALELANRDLLESHFNAIWLQKTGVEFPAPVASIMDYASDEIKLPIHSNYMQQLKNEQALHEALADIKTVIKDLGRNEQIPEHARHWLNDDYTPPDMYQSLEQALNRWRELYRTVREQLRQLNQIMHDLSRSDKEKNRARGLHSAVYSQEETMRTEGSQDFYSYRFLASQGFLPGYNFPRLPLVAFLPRGARRFDRLMRPRFLALNEFGPRSLIYHQGGRYRVSRAILRPTQAAGAGSTELPKQEMHICDNCGYGYLASKPIPDCCHSCHEPMTTPRILRTLYEIQDFVAQKTDRINAGEEERQRQGFELRTAYQFSPSAADKISGSVSVGDNTLLLDYGQAATVWRINLGWRRRQGDDGFNINSVTGFWEKADDEGKDNPDNYNERVIPYVQDSRNILIMRWETHLGKTTTTTLRHALKAGMIEVFQIDESELYVEPLPDGKECNAFLYYESVEGGAGVLSRLPSEKNLLAQIAKAALRLMHYDLSAVFTGEQTTTPADLAQHQTEDHCNSGCYRCLFSYYNQPEQENIDRKNSDALKILLALAQAEVDLAPATPDPAAPSPAQPEQNAWLLAAAAAGWRMPDKANHHLIDGIIADHYYTELQAAIFTDSATTAEQKTMLENAGYLCIQFPPDSEKWQTTFQHPANQRLFKA